MQIMQKIRETYESQGKFDSEKTMRKREFVEKFIIKF